MADMPKKERESFEKAVDRIAGQLEIMQSRRFYDYLTPSEKQAIINAQREIMVLARSRLD